MCEVVLNPSSILTHEFATEPAELAMAILPPSQCLCRSAGDARFAPPAVGNDSQVDDSLKIGRVAEVGFSGFAILHGDGKHRTLRTPRRR